MEKTTQSVPFFKTDTTRSRFVLEMASEMAGIETWPYRQARITLREQGGKDWKVCLFGSDTPAAIEEVARGEVHLAIINPAGPLAVAVQGKGPFREPIPLRAITVIPSRDQLAFAVTEGTGLKSLAEIRERRFPLRVSLRGQRDHSTHFFIKEVLSTIGFSLEDIVSWGGQVRYDEGLPKNPNRTGAVERGEADAIFDEAVHQWTDTALELGMRFLPIEESIVLRLENLGFKRAVIPKANYPKLKEDVLTLDFSGWPVFTHANVPDEFITTFCAALEARKDRISWRGIGPLPLESMCRDTPEGPLTIPLHPAAERFWKERGYIS